MEKTAVYAYLQPTIYRPSACSLCKGHLAFKDLNFKAAGRGLRQDGRLQTAPISSIMVEGGVWSKADDDRPTNG
jgi:hypothetical protein